MGRGGSGWNIEDLTQKKGYAGRLRWKARALDPKRGVYTYKSFPEKMPDASSGYAAAEAWAKATTARLRTGLDSTGKVSLAAIARDYLDQLAEEGRCAEHRREIQRVVDSLVAAGIADLQAKDFPMRVRSHLVRWTDQHRLRRGEDAEGNPIVYRYGERKGKPREPRPLALSTRARYLGHVKSIAKHAVTWDYLTKNPMDKVSLDVGETSKPTFNLDELHKLAAEPPEGRADFWLPMMNLLYGGFRLAEALHLRWEWIDWAGNMIHVRRHPAFRLKRNKERRVPLQPEHRAILEAHRRDVGWVVEDEALRAFAGVPSFYKLRDRDGKPRRFANHRGAYDRFKAYVEACGVTVGDRSPHSTRHTWVALMLATGEDSSFVQLWAGHRDIDTTLGYAGARDQLRDAVKGWPRGELRLLSAEQRARLGLAA